MPYLSSVFFAYLVILSVNLLVSTAPAYVCAVDSRSTQQDSGYPYFERRTASSTTTTAAATTTTATTMGPIQREQPSAEREWKQRQPFELGICCNGHNADHQPQLAQPGARATDNTRHSATIWADRKEVADGLLRARDHVRIRHHGVDHGS